MEWKSVENSEGGTKVPDSWVFVHYYDAFNVLFRIENTLRVLVFLVLKRNNKSKWQGVSLSSDDQSNVTIASLAKKRRAQDQAFGYLGYPIASPLMHLTSGELVGLITSESHWKYFKDYFLAAKSVVTLKLQEIGNVRNALAHFRPINPGDVDVVKQNARQVLSKAEETIAQLANMSSPIPSNTDEEWYKSLATLDSELVSFRLRQSVDEHWVKIEMKYKNPRISVNVHAKWQVVRVFSIKTPAILQHYPRLEGSVCFVLENLGRTYVRNPETECNKSVEFLFSRRTLMEDYSEIKEDLEGLLRAIETEAGLMGQDNLARGKFLTMRSVMASSSPRFKSL